MSKAPPKMSQLIAAIVVVVVAAFFGIDILNPSTEPDSNASKNNQASSQSTDQATDQSTNAWSSGSGSIADSQQALVKLVKAQQSGKMVELSARVVKVLKDDNDGDRHQRFLLAIDYSPSPASTILVAHNIDLAPRVPLSEDSVVRIFGQYEWNERGGVIHWTHHDPGGRHADGWIDLDGQRYD